MIAVRPTPSSLRHPLRFARIVGASILAVACGACSSGHIQESALTITPTESTDSFSRASQTTILELGFTADLLADPKILEENVPLKGASPAARALLLAESWFLRGQNDIEVPLATSLDRYLRAAHYAYDAIFALNGCANSTEPLCAPLLATYNRSAIEIARLTNNGTTLPTSNENTYLIKDFSDIGQLHLGEWEISLDESPATRPPTTFGGAGSGCQVITKASDSQGPHFRRCTPIAFVVSFANRADEGRSATHLLAFDTFTNRHLSLHDREMTLPVDEATTWSRILTPDPTHSVEASCLGHVEGPLPTVLLSLPQTSDPATWSTIASTLSSDPNSREHYNFCALTPSSEGEGSGRAQIIVDALDALSSPPSQRPTLVIIAQGAPNEELLRDLKASQRSRRGTDSTPGLTIAGSLTVPPFSDPNGASTTASPSLGELTRPQQGTLNDIKRLLSRLVDSDDGAFSGVRRSTLTRSSDMTLSPVM